MNMHTGITAWLYRAVHKYAHGARRVEMHKYASAVHNHTVHKRISNCHERFVECHEKPA